MVPGGFDVTSIDDPINAANLVDDARRNSAKKFHVEMKIVRGHAVN